MRKPSIALGAAAIVSLAFAAPANADETSYLDHMHNAGIMSLSGDSSMVQAGWDICDMVSHGAKPEVLAANIVYLTDKFAGAYGLNPNDADATVGYAVTDLCP